MADPILRAMVVCADDDTLLRLRDYLVRAGVETTYCYDALGPLKALKMRLHTP